MCIWTVGYLDPNLNVKALHNVNFTQNLVKLISKVMFRAPTGTGNQGKPGKLWKKIPCREKSWNFVKTPKSGKNHGILSQKEISYFSFMHVTILYWWLNNVLYCCTNQTPFWHWYDIIQTFKSCFMFIDINRTIKLSVTLNEKETILTSQTLKNI